MHSIVQILILTFRALFFLIRYCTSIIVSQTCNEDGMEFTLRTPEGFYGRIYTYGFYDR